MRTALLILLLCASCHASTRLVFAQDTPGEAMQSVVRAIAVYSSAGAKLPCKIRIVWDTRGAVVPFGWYAATFRRNGRWTIAINAHDMYWPRWEISLDRIFLHEIGHTLGWMHEPADSVMESPIYEHLTQSDLARIGGSK